MNYGLVNWQCKSTSMLACKFSHEWKFCNITFIKKFIIITILMGYTIMIVTITIPMHIATIDTLGYWTTGLHYFLFRTSFILKPTSSWLLWLIVIMIIVSAFSNTYINLKVTLYVIIYCSLGIIHQSSLTQINRNKNIKYFCQQII